MSPKLPHVISAITLWFEFGSSGLRSLGSNFFHGSQLGLQLQHLSVNLNRKGIHSGSWISGSVGIDSL
jgi:hypothetical protein